MNELIKSTRREETEKLRQLVLDACDYDEEKTVRCLMVDAACPENRIRPYLRLMVRDGFIKVSSEVAQHKYYVKLKDTYVMPERASSAPSIRESKERAWKFVPYKPEHIVSDIPTPEYAINKIPESVSVHPPRTRTGRQTVFVHGGTLA